MKVDKKDLPKIFILIGIFILALGICLSFGTNKPSKKKIDWKDQVDDYVEDIPSEEDMGGIDETEYSIEIEDSYDE